VINNKTGTKLAAARAATTKMAAAEIGKKGRRRGDKRLKEKSKDKYREDNDIDFRKNLEVKISRKKQFKN